MAFTQQESFQTYAHTTGSEYPINGFYFLYNESIKCRIYKTDGTYDDLVYGETADYIVDRKTVYRKSTWTEGLLLIYRENEYEQSTSYKNAEVVFDREQLERQLDYITMLVQQNKDLIDRAIITPLFDQGLMILPYDQQRYGKFMTFDVQGNIILRNLTPADFGIISIEWSQGEENYPQGILVTYDEALWLGVAPVAGSPPDLSRPTEWKRYKVDRYSQDIHSAENVDDAATITAGRMVHTVFADTVTNAFYTVTLDDGFEIGDKITVAAYGGGEVTVDGTGLTLQRQVDNAIQYLWSGAAWLPLGGGGAGGGSGVSVGEVTWWPGAGSIPDGKLVADGSVVNIADYPSLFGRVGTTWGGDGLATFGLPNLQGIFPGALGTQNINGNTKGDPTAVIGDYKEDQFQGHSHNMRYSLSDGGNINPKLGNTEDGQSNTAIAGTIDNGLDGDPRTGTYTDVSRAIGQWLIQAEPPAPSEVNAVVVDVQIGDVRWLPHTTINQYDLLCDGQIVNIPDYPELYALLGTTWGGDGATTFGIPNLQGIFPGAEGTQDIGGTTYGVPEGIGEYAQDDVKPHDHIFKGEEMDPHQHKVIHGSGTSNADDLFRMVAGTTSQDFDTTGVSAGIPKGIVEPSDGTQSRPASAIGQWVIRAKQPATFHIPDATNMFPPFDFGDKGEALEVGELIGDGTDSLVSSSGREPVVGNVEFIPGRSNIDGIDYYDPQLKWPGKGIYGVYEGYENITDMDSIPSTGVATIIKQGGWYKVEALTTTSPHVSAGFQALSTHGFIYCEVRSGENGGQGGFIFTDFGTVRVDFNSHDFIFDNGSVDYGSFFVSDSIAIVLFKPSDAGSIRVNLYANNLATGTIGDTQYYRNLMVVDLPFPVHYTKGTHNYNRWLYGMDWALSSQWTIEGWFYNTGDTSHAGYINIFHTAVGSIPNRWTVYFSPGERVLRLYTMLDSGGAGLVIGNPVAGWNHVKVLWESGTRFRASLNGAAYVETTSSVLETQDCNKIVALGSFGDDTGFFNSYLADWKAQAGIEDSHDHYLSDKAWYVPTTTYGKDCLWSITRHGHMTGLYDNAGRIIEKYSRDGQDVTKWDTGRMEISGTKEMVLDINAAHGDVFANDPTAPEAHIEYIEEFIGVSSIRLGSNGTMGIISANPRNDDTQGVQAFVFSSISYDDYSIEVSFIVIGRWK